MYGELHLGSQDSVGYNSDAKLYDWEVKKYKTQARGCWTIQIVQKKLVQQCFLVSIIPKIFEKKSREFPTLKPTNVSIKKISRYKGRESPVMHIEKVSKNIGEHGRLQSLVETLQDKLLDGGIPINQDCRHRKQPNLTF